MKSKKLTESRKISIAGKFLKKRNAISKWFTDTAEITYQNQENTDWTHEERESFVENWMKQFDDIPEGKNYYELKESLIFFWENSIKKTLKALDKRRKDEENGEALL